MLYAFYLLLVLENLIWIELNKLVFSDDFPCFDGYKRKVTNIYSVSKNTKNKQEIRDIENNEKFPITGFLSFVVMVIAVVIIKKIN